MQKKTSTDSTRKTLFTLYKLLSDYGFSVLRPFAWWAALSIIFGVIYGLRAGVPSVFQTSIDWSRTMQFMQYVLFNSIPLPGFEKAQLQLRAALFPHSTAGFEFMTSLLDVLHKGFALLFAFLIALALRNLFKMKG